MWHQYFALLGPECTGANRYVVHFWRGLEELQTHGQVKNTMVIFSLLTIGRFGWHYGLFFFVDHRSLWLATMIWEQSTAQSIMHFRNGTALELSVSAVWEAMDLSVSAVWEAMDLSVSAVQEAMDESRFGDSHAFCKVCCCYINILWCWGWNHYGVNLGLLKLKYAVQPPPPPNQIFFVLAKGWQLCRYKIQWLWRKWKGGKSET